jgi:hypothetical protein
VGACKHILQNGRVMLLQAFCGIVKRHNSLALMPFLGQDPKMLHGSANQIIMYLLLKQRASQYRIESSL